MTQLSLFEEDMTDLEREAVVADFVARYADVAPDAPQSKRCICNHPLLFAAELGEGRCGLCGREPR